MTNIRNKFSEIFLVVKRRWWCKGDMREAAAQDVSKFFRVDLLCLLRMFVMGNFLILRCNLVIRNSFLWLYHESKLSYSKTAAKLFKICNRIFFIYLEFNQNFATLICKKWPSFRYISSVRLNLKKICYKKCECLLSTRCNIFSQCPPPVCPYLCEPFQVCPFS